jgi:hypothetical protein|tara:strand:+ start:691 stop:1167 length:477 start_codon:yes stop_codon:yes gene_type:complete
MTHLVMAAALFFGIHIFVSGTKLRDAIVGMIGELPYKGLFAVTSLGAIVWMAMSYNAAVVSAENSILWQAPLGLLHSGGLIILVATLFAVIGVTAPSATTDGGDKAVAEADDPATRQPWSKAFTPSRGTRFYGVRLSGPPFTWAPTGIRPAPSFSEPS